MLTFFSFVLPLTNIFPSQMAYLKSSSLHCMVKPISYNCSFFRKIIQTPTPTFKSCLNANTISLSTLLATTLFQVIQTLKILNKSLQQHLQFNNHSHSAVDGTMLLGFQNICQKIGLWKHSDCCSVCFCSLRSLTWMGLLFHFSAFVMPFSLTS